ncbi:zona pellucida-like domain-containing protein 1 [Sphaeramia orbicularis]|uniref:zona pellucida-like domain-containing protein 1 n=1 Tax=Sphaeramia orbicularis TaxID=375764 RepID=UPI00117D7A92|nr:zona pellucida-like domain-containing protein 1 [Sphaeramia orbicularis]
MWLVVLLYQLGLIVRIKAQAPESCTSSVTNRPPENSDITVSCGTDHMALSILLCPIYQALYNESLMVLNNKYTKPECFGTANFSADPPVLNFRFPINETSLKNCGTSFKIITGIGTGQFADFSNVQDVNISGTVTSSDPSAGMITYRPQILYKFSCLYPMQYLLNNTQLGVSGVTLAINDNNGSFISTLRLLLYRDADYDEMLLVPENGLDLKTKIYVAVVATNLTNKFNVLLDRCYASKRPHPDLNTYYDLFVGCTRDAQTKVEINGESQIARFSFEAFRFVEDQNLTVSTFYLHCVTRLCEVNTCSSLKPNCDNTNRRRREAQTVSANATVSSPAINVNKQEAFLASSSNAKGPEDNYSKPVVAIIICISILAVLLIGMSAYFFFFIRPRKPLIK